MDSELIDSLSRLTCASCLCHGTVNPLKNFVGLNLKQYPLTSMSLMIQSDCIIKEKESSIISNYSNIVFALYIVFFACGYDLGLPLPIVLDSLLNYFRKII